VRGPVLLLEAAGPESEALTRTAAASGHPVHAVTDAFTLATYSGELRHLLVLDSSKEVHISAS